MKDKKMLLKLCTLIALTAHALCAAPTTPGTLDTTFNPNTGYQVTPIDPARDSGGESVAIQTDGKIVVAGWYIRNAGGNTGFAITRYNTNGILDTSFDTDGKVTTTIGTNASSYGVALQADGKIVAAGISDGSMTVARYNTSGSLDTTTFNASGTQPGTQSILINGDPTLGFALAIQPDQKIVVGGSTQVLTSNLFALARFLPNGNLDTTFNTTGTQSTSFGPDKAKILEIALQPDGKIVAAGVYGPTNPPGRVFALARYNSNGSLDTTFGAGGKLTTAIGTDAQGHTVALQPDGKIIAAGISDNQIAVVRYNANGSLDTTFGANGVVITPIGFFAEGYKVLVQPDGKIIVAGTGGAPSSFAVVRYTTTGSLDTTFNPNGATPGITTTLIGAIASGYSAALQQDGKIVVAGRTDQAGALPEAFAVARYNNIGALVGLEGTQNEVRYISQADLVNSLYWQAVTYATSYRITANGQALATSGVPNIEIHDMRPGNRIAYTVTPLNASGDEGVPASITLG